MVSSISREYVNMCLTGLPFRFRWALNQVFSSRLWLHSHHSKLSSPKSEANIQTFQEGTQCLDSGLIKRFEKATERRARRQFISSKQGHKHRGKRQQAL